jgi:poly(A) polymerase
VQQIVYPVDQHKLDRNQIDPDALYVLDRLRTAGYVAYLVGGSVRDLLLKRKPKDYDISTSAQPEEVKRLFRSCILIGRRFRLAHIRFGRKIIEVSTFRSGDNETGELIVRDNNWGSPEEDVMRRDFTINGLFYDSASETIIDYVGGYPDIERKYLRTIGQPFIRFKQDPVRMIRLIKFQARFGFEVDKEAHIALLECRSEIMKSSSARILEEILRMLEIGCSSTFIKLMTDHGLFQLMLPTIAHFLESPAGEEIYSYLKEVDTTFHEPPLPLLDRSILLSCLIYPLFQAKIKAKYLDRGRLPHLGEIQNLAHDQVSEIFHPFFLISRRLRYSIVSVITGQYRLTPLEKKPIRKLRVPKDPDFGLAIKFLEIRSCLEPGLQKVLEQWQEASKGHKIDGEPSSELDDAHARPKRRRRRRSPRKKGEGPQSEGS